MPKNIVITGGAGFIGANLLKAFSENGDHVLAVDDFSRGCHFVKSNNRMDLMRENAAFVAGLDYVKAHIGEPDVIIHCAAISRVANNPADYAKNMAMLMNVVLWSADFHPKLFIFCSSSAVYGNPPISVTAANSKMQPKSLYGMAKLHGEYFLDWACRSKQLTSAVSLRLPNVYGPGQYGGESGVVSIFLQNLYKNNPSEVREPSHVRDYVYIDDIVELFQQVIEANPEDWLAGHTWIPVGTKSELECWQDTMNVYKICSEVSGVNIGQPFIGESIPGEMKDTVQPPFNVLKWEPKVKFKEGVARVWDWVKAGKPRFE
jgi:UDP-glucose 4-epimerase